MILCLCRVNTSRASNTVHTDTNFVQLDLYCTTCHTVICNHGTVKDHRDHDYDLLVDVAAKHGLELCSQADQVTQLQRTLEEAITRIKAEETGLVAQAAAEKNNVTQHFSQLSQVLRRREQRLVGEIEAAQTRKQSILTRQREELEFAVASMESGSDQTGVGSQK